RGSGVVNVETGFGNAVIRGLKRRGHDVRFEAGIFGGYQAIAKDPDTGVYRGASESRKDGHAAGY
ncbi:MAG: gamma-glutamyltransferase, partial [Pseudomonadota bacterium]